LRVNLEHVNINSLQIFINMLDSGNVLKQSQRTHLCIELKIGKNKVYVPLRNNLGESLRKFGKIGFSVPSAKRPKAGLDYRYSLINFHKELGVIDEMST